MKEPITKDMNEYLQSDLQLCPPIKSFTPREVSATISALELKKSPGIPDNYRGSRDRGWLEIEKDDNMKRPTSSSGWIQAEERRNLERITSKSFYIDLLACCRCHRRFSKKLFLRRMNKVIEEHSLIPDHQFSFSGKHSTIEQVHRVVDEIWQSLEIEQYWSENSWMFNKHLIGFGIRDSYIK